jgi:hypothetical protein
MWSTCAENPHCGMFLLPFMNSTTSLPATVVRIQSWMSCCGLLIKGPLQTRLRRAVRPRCSAQCVDWRVEVNVCARRLPRGEPAAGRLRCEIRGAAVVRANTWRTPPMRPPLAAEPR